VKPKGWTFLSALVVLEAIALGIWVIWTDLGSISTPPSEKPARAEVEREHNWIWHPTLEDLRWAEGMEGGALHVRGPIVDETTDEPLHGDVYINGELVAEGVQEVSVLMWAAVERPVFLRVKASGYHLWELQFRFWHKGLSELKGPIRLKPAN